jgi:hypothetical protein
MRVSIKSTLVTAALLLTAAMSSAGTLGAFEFSNAPNSTKTVGAISDEVTYAKPSESLKTFVAFNVGSGNLLTNVSGNTVNNATIKFIASVTDRFETLKLHRPSFYLNGLPCSYPLTAQPGTLVITCTVRQFKAGATFPAFSVFYEAPAKVDLNGVGDAPGTDFVRLDIEVTYSEGTSGGNPQPNNSVAVTDGETVTLGTFNPTLVKSAVPTDGGSFFTGQFGVTLDSDRYATKVTLPSSAKSSRATIEETNWCTAPEQNFFRNCWQTNLTIEEADSASTTSIFDPYLTIILRQDANNIVPGTKIESVVLLYSEDGVSNFVPVDDCASPTTPRTDGKPCIAQRKHYKNRSVPGWTADLDNDFEWGLINIRNGSIRFPN